MRAPDLEAMIAEGEQEALLDFGYEHIIRLLEPLVSPGIAHIVDSTWLHAEVGRLAATGELPADDVTKVYDAVWSIKAALQNRNGNVFLSFSANEWVEEARRQARNMSKSYERPQETR